ncbi:MAG TPA: hypothetical protein VES79_10780 [Solirubrobacteraceae bacterium]|nr:hypothetical protein [Solirubrobacteraceae bacterium]
MSWHDGDVLSREELEHQHAPAVTPEPPAPEVAPVIDTPAERLPRRSAITPSAR